MSILKYSKTITIGSKNKFQKNEKAWLTGLIEQEGLISEKEIISV